MTDNEKLIEEAGEAIVRTAHKLTGIVANEKGEHGAREYARAAFAVFEKAHTPTDDEREAQLEPSDALNYLDEINGQGRIEYDDYRNLHDLISGALEPAPELFPGTLDALEGLTIRKGQES